MEKELFDKIESKRGYLDRSKYIRDILRRYIEETNVIQKNTDEIQFLRNRIERLEQLLALSLQRKQLPSEKKSIWSKLKFW